MSRRLASSLLLVVIAGAVAAGLPTQHASAGSSVPYKDPSATGVIGFCDSSYHPITSGSVNTRPFVRRAVGSMSAPAAYQGAGRKATLAAFQPREGADPSLWSGDTMTAGSTYTNVKHPMAQATNGDFSLADFISKLPPRWNGYLQLRLFYSAPNATLDQSVYAATDIRVSGSRWSVVRGGNQSCTSGSATSAEESIPSSSASLPNNAATGGPRSPSPGAILPSPAATNGASNASSSHGGGGLGTPALVLIIVAGALLVGGGAWVWRQWRSAGTSG